MHINTHTQFNTLPHISPTHWPWPSLPMFHLLVFVHSFPSILHTGLYTYSTIWINNVKMRKNINNYTKSNSIMQAFHKKLCDNRVNKWWASDYSLTKRKFWVQPILRSRQECKKFHCLRLIACFTTSQSRLQLMDCIPTIFIAKFITCFFFSPLQTLSFKTVCCCPHRWGSPIQEAIN